IACNDVRPDPQKSAHTIEKEKPRKVYSSTACQRRCYRIQSWNEFRHEQRAHTVLEKRVLGPAYAGVGLQRKLADEAQYFRPPASSKVKPDRIGNEAAGYSPEHNQKQIKPAAPHQCSARQQKWRRR